MSVLGIACQALFDRIDGLFEKADAVRLLFDDQGKRRLAYDIKNFQKGRYVTVSYFDGGKVVSDVERSLRLDESVLRFLTVRVAEQVTDIEGRKAAAREEEKLRAERAAERVAREEEEAKAKLKTALAALNASEELEGTLQAYRLNGEAVLKGESVCVVTPTGGSPRSRFGSSRRWARIRTMGRRSRRSRGTWQPVSMTSPRSVSRRPRS